MRLVMMGTGPFAVPTFRALVASPHDVAALVTRPARGKTRSSGPPDNPMRAAADELGIVVYEPENVNQTESVELLQSLQADLLVVCDYGQILRPSALATAARGGINLHGSLLPRHRGAAPVQWALICGDEETGVTVIHMTPQLDAGPCLVQVRTPIRADEDAQALEARLAEMGVDAVRDALDLLADWDGTSPLGWFQQGEKATRAPRLSKPDGALDWSLPALTIQNRVRAMIPWPGSFTFCPTAQGTLRLIVQRVDVVEGPQTPRAAGTIVHLADDALWVQAGDGRAVALRQVQPAGKRSMEIGEFLRGHRLQAGDRLTPEAPGGR